MRYYKLNNQYYSYNELHNTFGYTYTPTWSVTYLLVSPWGDNTQTINGYSEPTNVYSESSYFVENSIGWFTLNQLSINEGYFPSNVESTTLVRNGETSNVVFLSFADEPRYLIEKDLSVGWLTEQEYTERGWGKGTGIILIDKTQDEETFIASLPYVEFLTKDEHIPDIEKSLLELPIVPQIEFITKDVHIPSINKTLLEIPAPTSIDLINKSNLPTVELFSVDGYKDYVYINKRGNAVTLQPNSTGDFYIIPISGGTGERTGYGSSKIYALSYWEYNEGELYNRVGIDVISNSGWLGWRSLSNWGFLRGKLYSCDSTSASVVTVYDSSNSEYNAFKFTLSGTDYYYVLDEVQITWTNDLSSIGYSEVPSVVAISGVVSSTSADDIVILDNYPIFGVLAQDS